MFKHVLLNFHLHGEREGCNMAKWMGIVLIRHTERRGVGGWVGYAYQRTMLIVLITLR